MNRIDQEKERRNKKLKDLCNKFSVNPESLNRLIESEKTKKLFKRRAFMQSAISNEIKGELNED